MIRTDQPVLEGEPHFILRARDFNSPAVLRALAGKTRVVNPEAAGAMEQLATDMAAWRAQNPGVR